MRKIRGWIKTLANASGPPAGTVEVAARFNDAAELDLEAHGLGYLDRTHQTGGAGALNLADAGGHFGWDMEFSPGPITTRIIASDPLPAQYRMRLPDESAQVGKAFHSDLERLGWAAGRDCLVYGAIEGAGQPTAETWSTDPLLSSRQGDWSVADFGTGGDAGRVLLNKGIGFLGGVVFSIENPNAPLLVPVLGEDAAPANGGTEDRWDLLVAWMDVADPLSATYGKQGISIQRGTAGEAIPSLEARSGYRQMVLHALKMAAGGGVYTEAFDLRGWAPGGMPPFTTAAPTRAYAAAAYQSPSPSFVNSVLNTAMASDEVILPLFSRWAGVATWTGVHGSQATGPNLLLYVAALTEGRDVTGELVDGSDYIVKPTAYYTQRTLPVGGSLESVTDVWPISVIPAAPERTWSRLRFRVRLGVSAGTAPVIGDQHFRVILWPIP